MLNQILSQQAFAMDLETRIFKLVIQCKKIEFTGSISKSQWPLMYLWPDFKFSQCISCIKISLHYIPGNNSYISEHDNDVVTFKQLRCVCVCATRTRASTHKAVKRQPLGGSSHLSHDFWWSGCQACSASTLAHWATSLLLFGVLNKGMSAKSFGIVFL